MYTQNLYQNNKGKPYIFIRIITLHRKLLYLINICEGVQWFWDKFWDGYTGTIATNKFRRISTAYVVTAQIYKLLMKWYNSMLYMYSNMNKNCLPEI